MKLLTNDIKAKLIANFNANKTRPCKPLDFEPVLKLFVPWGAATWIFTEMDPDDNDTLFGLAFLGENIGEPELGYVSLSELQSISGPLGLKIERDMHFKADKTLAAYAAEARQLGRLVA